MDPVLNPTCTYFVAGLNYPGVALKVTPHHMNEIRSGVLWVLFVVFDLIGPLLAFPCLSISAKPPEHEK